MDHPKAQKIKKGILIIKLMVSVFDLMIRFFDGNDLLSIFRAETRRAVHKN